MLELKGNTRNDEKVIKLERTTLSQCGPTIRKSAIWRSCLIRFMFRRSPKNRFDFHCSKYILFQIFDSFSAGFHLLIYTLTAFFFALQKNRLKIADKGFYEMAKEDTVNILPL